MDNSNPPVSMQEHLSSVLDDEAGNFEQRRVLDELKKNDSLCEKLSTYALIGETMRTSDMEKPVLNVDTSFLAGIHDRLEKEDEYNEVQLQTFSNSDSSNSKSWIKPVGGFALAASLAAVAVLGIQNFQQSAVLNQPVIAKTTSNHTSMIAQKDQLSESEMTSATEVSAASLINNNLAANENKATQEYVQADTKTRSLLKRYVDSHMQYASTAAFVPSVRVIAYTDNQ